VIRDESRGVYETMEQAVVRPAGHETEAPAGEGFVEALDHSGESSPREASTVAGISAEADEARDRS
jgi:hypothetical protein